MARIRVATKRRRLTIVDLIAIIAISSIYLAAFSTSIRYAARPSLTGDTGRRMVGVAISAVAPILALLTWLMSVISSDETRELVRGTYFLIHLSIVGLFIFLLLTLFDIQPFAAGLIAVAWPTTVVYLSSWK